MIAGRFHEGSGLGDQLFRYITTRTLALDKNIPYGMVNPDGFKGESFMPIQLGMYVNLPEAMNQWLEKDVRDKDGNDIRSYDPEINFVEDNTVIDGSFEDDKYWGHRLDEIRDWLKVEPLEMQDDVCVIGFRGGEYALNPDLFLAKDYWNEAINTMIFHSNNQDLRFQVHTDDPSLAKQFFPSFEIVENAPISHSKHTNMGFNWRSARYAKYAIIPNSAFFILPRLLKHLEDPTAVTIAPRYWARRKAKVWARPACYYKQFQYI